MNRPEDGMRQEPYAELTLYCGFVKSGCLGDGPFNLDDTEMSRQRRLEAMQQVHRYLHPSYINGLEIFGTRPFKGQMNGVQSENEAQALLDYAIRNIEGAETHIDLSHVCHERLVFRRKIRFNGWAEERTKELTDKIRQSGVRVRFLDDCLKFYDI